jgi:hypothetical protein
MGACQISGRPRRVLLLAVSFLDELLATADAINLLDTRNKVMASSRWQIE